MRAQPKAPWAQRFGVLFFTVLAGLLVFWLLGFVVDDIGEIQGPDLAETEKRFLDQSVVSQVEAIDKQIALIKGQIDSQKSRQALLRDSTTSSRETMTQLLEMQKLNIQNKVTPSAAERDALAESEALFIANQTQYQNLNLEIARLTDEQQRLQTQKEGHETKLATQQERAAKEHDRLQRRHNLRVAAFQLLVLIPLLALAVFFVLRWRVTIYAPLIYAFGVASLAKVVIVIHQHFPTRYFKYVLLLFSLAVVIRVLVFLIQSTSSPRLASLLKQYREAYERFLCPICEYPIRRGPMKYSYWDRRSVRKLPPLGSSNPETDEPYGCPSCGSPLFEPCDSCGSVRHALLPFCEHCRKEKNLAEPRSESAG